MSSMKEKEQLAWYIILGCIAIIVLFVIASRFTHEKSHTKETKAKTHTTLKLKTAPQPTFLASRSRQ